MKKEYILFIDSGIGGLSTLAETYKIVPAEFINREGNGVTEEFIKYARPLIMGESYPVYENGMPCHLVLSK